jgi:hypothetical protein
MSKCYCYCVVSSVKGCSAAAAEEEDPLNVVSKFFSKSLSRVSISSSSNPNTQTRKRQLRTKYLYELQLKKKNVLNKI